MRLKIKEVFIIKRNLVLFPVINSFTGNHRSDFRFSCVVVYIHNSFISIAVLYSIELIFYNLFICLNHHLMNIFLASILGYYE